MGFQRLENLNLVPPPLQRLKVSGQIRSVWLLNYVRQSVPVLVLEVYLDVIQCFSYFRPSTGLIALGLGSSSCRLLSEPFLVSESLLLSSPDFLVSRSSSEGLINLLTPFETPMITSDTPVLLG